MAISAIPAHCDLAVVDGHVAVIIRRIRVSRAAARHPHGTEQLGGCGRDVIPVLDRYEKLWRRRQLSVNDQHAVQAIDTSIGEVVVPPKKYGRLWSFSILADFFTIHISQEKYT